MPQIEDTLLDDAITSLAWLTTDARLRFDETRGNLEEGSRGGYSPELMKALATLERLRYLRRNQ